MHVLPTVPSPTTTHLIGLPDDIMFHEPIDTNTKCCQHQKHESPISISIGKTPARETKTLLSLEKRKTYHIH